MSVKKHSKSALLVILAFVVLFVSTPISNAKLDIDLELGDANCDGKINSGDCIAVLQFGIGLRKLGFYGELAADVNGDELINSGDATLILRYIVGEAEFSAKPLNVISTNVNYNKIKFESVSLGDKIDIDLSEYTSYTATNPFGATCYALGYKLDLTEGTWVVFETSLMDLPVDTVMFLLDSKCNMFAANDDGGDGGFSRLEFYVQESGAYNLLVCSIDTKSVGSCYLDMQIGNLPSPSESPTPTPKPTETPEPTATPVPTPSPTPIPTNPPTGNVELLGANLPCDNQVLQYGRAYSIAGNISSLVPITNIKIEIYKHDNTLEAVAQKVFSVSDNVLLHSLTDGGTSSLNDLLAFSSLTFGAKTLVLTVKTEGFSEETLFLGNFFMGATDSILSGNAYNSGTTPLNAEHRKTILDYLNSLNPNELGTHAVMNAFTILGTPYGTGVGQLDCSAAMRKAYSPLGVELPRTSEKQGEFCLQLNGMMPLDALIPGDFIFFTDNTCTCGRFMEIHHVAMFVGTINGTRYYIESSYGVGKVVLRIAWGETGTGRWSIAFYSRPYVYASGASNSNACEVVM